MLKAKKLDERLIMRDEKSNEVTQESVCHEQDSSIAPPFDRLRTSFFRNDKRGDGNDTNEIVSLLSQSSIR